MSPVNQAVVQSRTGSKCGLLRHRGQNWNTGVFFYAINGVLPEPAWTSPAWLVPHVIHEDPRGSTRICWSVSQLHVGEAQSPVGDWNLAQRHLSNALKVSWCPYQGCPGSMDLCPITMDTIMHGQMMHQHALLMNILPFNRSSHSRLTHAPYWRRSA